MLRAVLLGCPVVLVFAVSCSGGDAANFTGGGPGSAASAGTSSSTGGTSATGGSSSQGGSNAAAGEATAGKTSTAGSSNTAGSGNTAGNGNTAGSGNTAGTAGNATAGSGGKDNTAGNTSIGGKGGSGGNASSGTANAGGAGGAGGAAGAGGDSTGPLCPDIFGTYTITNVDGGVNCTGVTKNAMQSIAGTEIVCRAHFVSESPNPNGPTGVNGGAALDENGNFTGASLMFNKTPRTGCTGTWDAGNERMTIKCGGQGDQCTVVMERN